jgi:hypothetical protein
MDRFRPDKYLAGIRLDNPRNNFHERGFSRPIFAQQRMHTASQNIEGNLSQCPRDTVRLADPDYAERW